MARILIVDDERSIRETLSEFVKDLGHEVSIAAEAAEALEIASLSALDVIVSDIILPGADGLALLERLRAISPDTQVIIITGEPTVDTAAGAVRQGAFDYLSKPVSRKAIQSAVERALRVKEIVDERRRLTEENLRYREHLEEEVRRKAQALASSEEQYRTVVENANEAVFVAQGTTLKFANPKTSEITGYSNAELLAMPFIELIHPEDRTMVVERYQRRLAGSDVPEDYAFRVLTAEGDTRWIEIRPVLIEWEGEPATLNFAIEITKRKLLQIEAEARRERIQSRNEALIRLATQRILSRGDPMAAFRLITETCVEVLDVDRASVWLFDEEGDSIRCIDLYVRTSGEHRDGYTYTRKAIARFLQELERNLFIAVSDINADPRMSEFALHRSQDRGTVAALDAAIRSGGEMVGDVCFETTGQARDWTHEDEEFAGSIATLVALTLESSQRRRAEVALGKSERKWRELFENLRDGWVSADMEGNLRECNAAYEKLLGYSIEELKQLTYRQLTPEKWWAYEQDIVERLIIGRGYSGTYQKEYIRKDGTVFPVELNSYLMGDESGKPVGTWGLARDITDRVSAERALEESQARYRTLFENSPISLWQDDYSQTKALLDELRAGGVTDMETYLQSHPETVEDCIQRIGVVDVNEATVALHRARSKDDLLGNLAMVIPAESRRAFIPQLLAMANGETSYEGIGVDQRLDGQTMHVSIRWIVAPGFENTLGRVLVSKIDVTATVEAEAALQTALDGTIEAIGRTTETRDPYTAGHQRRVTELAVSIAEELGLAVDMIAGIRAAGLMHDIGKMAVPAEILSKPSSLSATEMLLIQSHPQVAYDILETTAFPWPVADIVLQHQERMDGSGYPRGLSGDGIMIEARILAVADTVEAMASHRPYRAALGVDAALEEIESHMGERYDPNVVNACLRLFKEGRFAFTSAGHGHG